ncbi:MAG: hypothetical protein IT370_02740 [Deltaproteobacteria bacterium]|nr:hypothetical protein [Deltaproteobacteria bacterium]
MVTRRSAPRGIVAAGAAAWLAGARAAAGAGESFATSDLASLSAFSDRFTGCARFFARVTYLREARTTDGSPTFLMRLGDGNQTVRGRLMPSRVEPGPVARLRSREALLVSGEFAQGEDDDDNVVFVQDAVRCDGLARVAAPTVELYRDILRRCRTVEFPEAALGMSASGDLVATVTTELIRAEFTFGRGEITVVLVSLDDGSTRCPVVRSPSQAVQLATWFQRAEATKAET